jgi:hypothetical protein
MSVPRISWKIIFHDDFVPEFRELPDEVREGLAALLLNLRERGPLLGRPWADTLKGSKHANMKELRLDAGGGVWRVAFAFDPERRAVLLVAGSKAGVAKARFYGSLVRVADARFEQHLKSLKAK